MNEKSLEVLSQYDINIYKAGRGRGGMILNTDRGIMLFCECVKSDRYYEREDNITKAVYENGFECIDTYVRNSAGNLICISEDGSRYVLKKWFDARECNVSDISDISSAVSTLARLHKTLGCVLEEWKNDSVDVVLKAAQIENGESLEPVRKIPYPTSIRQNYKRHVRELKLASNYLRAKKKRTEFEQIAFKNISEFYNEAVVASGILNGSHFDEKFKKLEQCGELCHGNYNYHNILFDGQKVAVTNFDKYKNESQMSDLHQFMRKILEKCNWDIQVAYKMLDAYDKVKPIDSVELELLAAMFAFPDKFWKIINFYFNSNKAWIPPKSIAKLQKVVEQNDRRRAFLTTVM